MTAHANEAGSATTASSAPRSRTRQFFSFRDPGTESHPLMRHLTYWDAQIYFVLVGIGLPLMTMLVPDLLYQMIIVMVFFAFMPSAYWDVEITEITTQIRLNGILDPLRTRHQRNTMWLPIFGVVLAGVVQIVSWVDGGRNMPWLHVRYGLLEWSVLVHTLYNAGRVIAVIDPMITYYDQLSGARQRFEQQQQQPH